MPMVEGRMVPDAKMAVGARKSLLDRLALLGAALLLIGTGGAAFVLADKYHISDAWIFAGCASLTLFAIVGWPYRSQFRNPTFVKFFVVWLLVHVFVFLLVLGYLGLLYYFPFLALELWIGYAIAIRLFGHPPGRTH